MTFQGVKLKMIGKFEKRFIRICGKTEIDAIVNVNDIDEASIFGFLYGQTTCGIFNFGLLSLNLRS